MRLSTLIEKLQEQLNKHGDDTDIFITSDGYYDNYEIDISYSEGTEEIELR